MNRFALSGSLGDKLDYEELSTMMQTGRRERLTVSELARIVQESSFLGAGKRAYCRETFKIFRRADGYILTISVPAYYWNTSTRMVNYPFSPFEVVDAIFREISKSNIEDLDVDWLFVHILTTLVKRDALSREFLTKGLLDDLGSRVQEMRSRRNSPDDPVELVRQYVELIDTVSQIEYIGEQKVRVLEKFRKDTANSKSPPLPEMKAPHSTETIQKIQSVAEMIEDALEEVRERNHRYHQYTVDLKSGLDVIFQLATIEQNALALRADKNNRAILVFTI
ncbi:MAG: hypothetical protein Q9168_006468, partial [Polycauliona sp. 1 TL-2023]